MKEMHNPQLRLRKTIGILGLALPILLLAIHQHLLASMSHYYYTSASVFFIGILSAFGLVLFSYKGYPIEKEKGEKVSDDTITTLASFFIFFTILLPTNCDGAMGPIRFCDCGYLFGHHTNWMGTVHLISAGMFLALLGVMCKYKFTMGNSSSRRKTLYRWCAYIIWGSIAFIGILFGIEKITGKDLNDFLPGYTFFLEWVAVWAFAVAWLVKGRIEEVRFSWG